MALTGCGTRAVAVLDPAADMAVTVSLNGAVVWRGVPGRWRPWKLLAADIDGDGRSEVLLVLNKATRRMARRHNCLFVYGLRGRTVVPMWLGSRLSRPFEDIAVGEVAGWRGDSVAVLDRRLDGRLHVTLYRWNGFGFDAAWGRGDWRSGRLVGVRDGGIAVQADGRTVVLRRKVP